MFYIKKNFKFKTKLNELLKKSGMVTHAFYPSTQEAEAEAGGYF